MDINAADILDAARVKLQQLKDNGEVVMIKPICLLFLFEIYLEVQVNI